MTSQCSSCDVATTKATMDPRGRCATCAQAALPKRLGKYEVERLVGVGGMGEVYLARHPELFTRVAIKVLREDGQGPALTQRFLREARLTAAITHPGVVRVHDFDRDGDRLYLVMDFVEGTTVRERLESGPLSVSETVRIAKGVALVLAAAHDEGVVHRDIKPANVMIDGAGTVRVLDFGVSRAGHEGETVTRTGEIVGTPEYMAPEQILDAPEDVDGRADVYALGVLMYEMLTGTCPFRATNVFQVLKLVESHDPQSAASLRSDVPEVLSELVRSAMSKVPGARPSSASAVALALSEITARDASGVRRVGPLREPLTAAPAPRHALRRAVLPAALIALVLGLLFVGYSWLDRTRGKPETSAKAEGLPRAVDRLRSELERSARGDDAPLRSVLRTVAPTDSDDASLLIARGRRELGELHAALEILEREAASSSMAHVERALTFTLAHRLPLALLDMPRLRDLPASVRDELFEERAELSPLARTTVVACRSLLEGDSRPGALDAMVANEPPASLLRALTIEGCLQRNDVEGARQRAASLAAARPQCPTAEAYRIATLPRDQRAGLLEALVLSLPRTEPERYLLGLVRTLLTEDRDAQRAYLELAAATGAVDEALCLYIAGELQSSLDREPLTRPRCEQFLAELSLLHGSRVQGVATLTATLEALRGDPEVPLPMASDSVGVSAALLRSVAPEGSPEMDGGTPAARRSLGVNLTTVLLGETAQVVARDVVLRERADDVALRLRVLLCALTGTADARSGVVTSLATRLTSDRGDPRAPEFLPLATPSIFGRDLGEILLAAHGQALGLGEDRDALTPWTVTALLTLSPTFLDADHREIPLEIMDEALRERIASVMRERHP